MNNSENYRAVLSLLASFPDFESGNKVRSQWRKEVTLVLGASVACSSAAAMEDQAISMLTRLEKLRCPQPAAIVRKGRVTINPPPCGKQRSEGCGNFAQVRQCVREFPDEQLSVSAGKLFLIAISKGCISLDFQEKL